MRPDRQPAGRFPGADTDDAKLRALRVAGWFLLVGPALYLVLIALAYPDQAMRGAGPALVLILAAATLLLLRAGKLRSASRVLVYGAFAGLIPTVLLNGGLQAPQVHALPLAILLAGWLLGVRHAVALTTLALAFVLGLATAPAGLPPPPSQPALSVLPLAVVLLITGVLTSYIVRSNDKRLAEVRRLGEALAAEKSQLAEIAENIPAFIFHGDRAMRCRFANRRYAEFFGFTPENIIGMSVADILGEASARAIHPKLLAVLAGETVRYGAIRRSLVDGKEHHLDISFVPEHDESGEVVGFYALKLDVTERIQAEDRLAKVFHASPVAISITRLKDSHVLDVNDAFVEQFGWSREEILGRTSLEFGLWPSAEARQRWVAGIGPEERSTNHEVLLNTRSGAQCAALISTERIVIDGEACLLCLIHDVTDRKKLEDETRILNTELERRVVERTADLTSANRELESFAYSISHDLRAPLRGIDGFSQLLLEEYQDKLDATGRGYLDRVRRAAQRMGTLIDDILELSRVTRHSMRRTHVDLSQLAREILDELAHGAPGCAIEASIAPDCTAFGDPQLLRVLMQNLLENAWKYSGRQAAPKIAFGRETADGEAVFFVRDNGVGFDMKYAGRLFTPFQRLHKPEEFEGTGIGLATVARIVQRHGGRVWAEAVPGQGAVFRFTLPGWPRESKPGA